MIPLSLFDNCVEKFPCRRSFIVVTNILMLSELDVSCLLASEGKAVLLASSHDGSGD
jgi:hypothetical protein